MQGLVFRPGVLEGLPQRFAVEADQLSGQAAGERCGPGGEAAFKSRRIDLMRQKARRRACKSF
jgi:hypothetical protein